MQTFIFISSEIYRSLVHIEAQYISDLIQCAYATENVMVVDGISTPCYSDYNQNHSSIQTHPWLQLLLHSHHMVYQQIINYPQPTQISTAFLSACALLCAPRKCRTYWQCEITVIYKYWSVEPWFACLISYAILSKRKAHGGCLSLALYIVVGFFLPQWHGCLPLWYYVFQRSIMFLRDSSNS